MYPHTVALLKTILLTFLCIILFFLAISAAAKISALVNGARPTPGNHVQDRPNDRPVAVVLDDGESVASEKWRLMKWVV
jgi:hypothetical protein